MKAAATAPGTGPGRRRFAVAVAIGGAVLIGLGWTAWSILGSPDTGPSGADGPVPPAGPGLPTFGHVYVVMLENRSLGDVIGDPSAPYLNGLAARGGLATGWYGLARPSQPNYLALFAGSTFHVQDNFSHDLGARTLADQLEEHGLTWQVYAENLPPGCFTGGTASGGADGPGTYARKHEPAISFRQISGDPARCARITDLSHFAPAAARFNLIIPNLCHDMHDCGVAEGDAFLAAFVPRILSDPSWGIDDLLVVTFDEGNLRDQRIATILVSNRIVAGTRSAVRHDHYSLLRTLEASWGLGCLANACTANDIGEFFRPTTAPAGSRGASAAPVPAASP